MRITKIPGTERGHFYKVVGHGEKGLVGVRDLGNGEHRVRIQGWLDEYAAPDGFTKQSKHHASTVVDEEQLDETIDDALDYIV